MHTHGIPHTYIYYIHINTQVTVGIICLLLKQIRSSEPLSKMRINRRLLFIHHPMKYCACIIVQVCIVFMNTEQLVLPVYAYTICRESIILDQSSNSIKEGHSCNVKSKKIIKFTYSVLKVLKSQSYFSTFHIVH